MSGYEVVYYVLAAAAAAAGGAAVYQQNQAVSASNQANAAAADYNAQLAEQNAAAARAAAGAREDQQRREARAFLARQRAAAAQSGLDPGTGSLGLMIEQSADTAEVDALMIRHGGDMEARGFAAQGTLDSYGAEAYRRNAAASQRAAGIGAGASLLSSGANYSYNALQINRSLRTGS